MLEHFFLPRTVAVIGASHTEGKVGYDVFRNLTKSCYKGRVYPVNIKGGGILGYDVFKSIKEVSDEIDLAIIVVPANYVRQVVDECIEKRIDSIVVISAGFKESGIEGAIRERELVRKIKQHSIRMLGPNCLGLINTQAGLNASFAADMPVQGNIAFFSQSGALCTSVLDWAMGERIGFSKFISIGNKADIDEVDIIKALDADDATKVILGYLEGIRDGKVFIDVAQRITKHKPIIIVKSGSTVAGAKAASSHTGTLAGSENAFDAAFKQTGILRARTIEDLTDYAKIFSYQPFPKGPRVAVITNAGGPGIIAADAIERSQLKMANLSKKTINDLRLYLPEASNVYNPVDVLGDAKADRYKFVLEKILRDCNVDIILIILTPQAMTEIEKTAQVIAEVSAQTEKTIVSSFIGGARVETGVEIMRQKHIPNYTFPERAVSAIEAIYRHTLWQKKPVPAIKTFDIQKKEVISVFDRLKQARRTSLSEMEARRIISCYGLNVPKSILVTTESEAVNAAEEIGYPVVLKISSPDILHKSDFGGVIVGLKDAADVRKHFCDIIQRARRLMPDAEISGALVQEMVTGGKEVILGMSRDPQFGPLLMFGLGGIYVEVLKDVSFRIAPVTPDDAEQMVREIRSFPLLKGIRGEKPVDLDAIIDNLLRLSQLVTDFPEIMEMDVNPLVVFPDNKGAIAIDARLTISKDSTDKRGDLS